MFHVMLAATGRSSRRAPRPHRPGYGGHVFWTPTSSSCRTRRHHPTPRAPSSSTDPAPSCGRRAARRAATPASAPWSRASTAPTSRQVRPRRARWDHAIHTGSSRSTSRRRRLGRVAALLVDRQLAPLGARGRPLLLETARYWASRIRLDDAGRGISTTSSGPRVPRDVNDDVFTTAWRSEPRARRRARAAPRRCGGPPRPSLA